MGTSWAEVIANDAMREIDDTRLQDEAAEDPAAFLRKMSLYMVQAIPMMSKPVELTAYLENGMTTASYDDYEWESTEESTTKATTVTTGLTGFELFSCVSKTVDSAGNVSLTPYTEATYDKTTGNVTFPTQSESGIDYVMDFYTDGSFANTLSQRIRNLLALAIAALWDARFNNNWLAMTMKIHDKSFDTVNESNYIRETGTRHKDKLAQLSEELRSYEQDCAYMKIVPTYKHQTAFL